MSLGKLAVIAAETNTLIRESNRNQEKLLKALAVTNWVNIITIIVAAATLVAVLL